MAEETLLTASRRAARFFAIDMNKGGIITVETQYAFHILEREIERAAACERAAEKTLQRSAGGEAAPPVDIGAASAP